MIAGILLAGCLLPVMIGLGVVFTKRISPTAPDPTAAKSVKPVNDQQITKTIMEKLDAEKKAGNLNGFNIELTVEEGTVWLSGRVSSEEQRMVALEIARRVQGVKQVVNDLRVEKSKSDTLPNSSAPAPSPPKP
jgi:BON domain-containing protein